MAPREHPAPTLEQMNHAQDIIEHWRHEYNTERPHSSLGNQTPEAYARARQQQVSCNADSSFPPY